MHPPRRITIYLGLLLVPFALLLIISQLRRSPGELLNRAARVPEPARFTSLNLAGLRDRRGQGVYNIPVENHNGGWEQTEFPDLDENQELKDAQSKLMDIYRPLGDLDPADPRPPLNGGVEDQQDYASFYRAYSAYQLPHEVSNQGPRNPFRPATLPAGWTEDGYHLPPYGQPYSKPVRFGPGVHAAVTLNAGGDGSRNTFRVSGPGVMNVQLGPGQSEGEVEGAAAPAAAPPAKKELKKATGKDWASASGRKKLVPCPADGSGGSALPWLTVTPETQMCLDEPDPAAATQFWQDAYDDAYW